MRVVKAFQPFSRTWVVLWVVALLLTFGAGGGTPNSTAWLVVKFVLLGVLLAGVLATLAAQLRERLMRAKRLG